MVEALAFQLCRLESMQEAGAKVMTLPRLGIDVFPRGAPEGIRVIRKPVFEVSLYELLKAYGDQQRRTKIETLAIVPTELYSVDDALERLGRLIGEVPDWQTLASFLPRGLLGVFVRRSAVAAHFAAALEMTRQGKAEMRQGEVFGPISLRQGGGRT